MSMDRTLRTQHAYDASALEYAGRTSERSPEASSFFDRFVVELAPGSLVADLGCGPGDVLSRLEDSGHCPVGVDRSASMLKLASRRGMTTQADLRFLPFANDSLDALWSSAALLHVERPEIEQTIAEWDRVVRPGGVIGLTTSLGADEGWELVPAGPARIPTVPEDAGRWFVHHHESELTSVVKRFGWVTVERSVRKGHRDWMQLIARTNPP